MTTSDRQQAYLLHKFDHDNTYFLDTLDIHLRENSNFYEYILEQHIIYATRVTVNFNFKLRWNV
jgi:hypothetical protein